MTKNLWKNKYFGILAFYVKQNTLSKSLMSSLETVENGYLLFFGSDNIKRKEQK